MSFCNRFNVAGLFFAGGIAYASWKIYIYMNEPKILRFVFLNDSLLKYFS